MKMKKKGKVYPSTLPPTQQQPSPSQHTQKDNESLSVLKLLPATILVLVSILSAEDKEVLAYLITRGTTVSSVDTKTSKKNKKNKSGKNHKPPFFDCECFDCYTNYWLRWDSSENRELIHQIIEAFENLTNGENSGSRSNKTKRGNKKKEKFTRLDDNEDKNINTVLEVEPMTESHVLSEVTEVEEREPEDEIIEVKEEEEEMMVVLPAVASVTEHKGLARKVLPDVLGLLNSNFWRLWNPNA